MVLWKCYRRRTSRGILNKQIQSGCSSVTVVGWSGRCGVEILTVVIWWPLASLHIPWHSPKNTTVGQNILRCGNRHPWPANSGELPLFGGSVVWCGPQYKRGKKPAFSSLACTASESRDSLGTFCLQGIQPHVKGALNLVQLSHLYGSLNSN